MNKLCSASLVAVALTLTTTTSQARPTQKAIDEARVRTVPAGGQYMRLDPASANTCADALDSGENRFDRMYVSISPSTCKPRY